MPNRSGVRGVVASRGYASGRLFCFDAEVTGYVASGDADIEVARLRTALAAAATEVAALVAEADADGADILEFQLAMLEDETLVSPALDAIAAGGDALAAWVTTLDAEMAGYLAADDAYFQARSADLMDIRDRVQRLLVGAVERLPPASAVLFGRDLTPTRFLAIDWRAGGGIVLTAGSTASHVAMLARARGVPMLVGADGLEAADGQLALLDAVRGEVTVDPDGAAFAAFERERAGHAKATAAAREGAARPAMTADGIHISVLINVAEPDEVDGIDIGTCDGVGLMRTEFLFGHGLPDEETQFAAYRRVLAWAAGKPVTIRTVDAGGDKPVPGFTREEANPFLGVRGVRLSLQRPEVFRVQARALLRAAALGPLKVMFPMISVVDEYGAAGAIFAEEAGRLAAEGVDHAMPELGIMVEVPAVAIAPEPFAGVGFMSIGSNDLTQYVMAAGRDSAVSATLADVRHPAVLALIAGVTNFGAARGIPVSLCGDAASEPAAIPELLRAGLRTLSVAPAQLALAKAAIAATYTTGAPDGAGATT